GRPIQQALDVLDGQSRGVPHERYAIPFWASIVNLSWPRLKDALRRRARLARGRELPYLPAWATTDDEGITHCDKTCIRDRCGPSGGCPRHRGGASRLDPDRRHAAG